MFSYLPNLVSVDLNGFDTSDVTDMQRMFMYDRMLQTIDLASLDTSKVENIDEMFLMCRTLKTLNLSDFDSLTSMYRTFNCCGAGLCVDLNKFNTSKVTTMGGLFGQSSLTSLDVSGFDTSNVTNMCSMFEAATSGSITSLNLSNFNTSKVTDMAFMFSDCINLKTLDLSSFNTANVSRMTCMFLDCPALEEVKLGTGFSKWDSDALLPEGNWKNGSLVKTAAELADEYPGHRTEWAGTWVKDNGQQEDPNPDDPTVSVIQDEETNDLRITSDDPQWLSEMADLKWSDRWPSIQIGLSGLSIRNSDDVVFVYEDDAVSGIRISYETLMAYHIASEASTIVFPATENYEPFTKDISDLHLKACAQAPEGMKIKETEEGLVFYFDNPSDAERDYLNSIVRPMVRDLSTNKTIQKTGCIRIYAPDNSQMMVYNTMDVYPGGEYTYSNNQILLSDDGSSVYIPVNVIMNQIPSLVCGESYLFSIQAYGYTIPADLELEELIYGNHKLIDDFYIDATLDENLNLTIRSNDQDWIEAACRIETFDEYDNLVQYGSYFYIVNAKTGRTVYFNNSQHRYEDPSQKSYELRTDEESGEKYIFVSRENLADRFSRNNQTGSAGEDYYFRFYAYYYQPYTSSTDKEGEHIVFTEDLIKTVPSIKISENKDGDIVIESENPDDDYRAYLNSFLSNEKNFIRIDTDTTLHMFYSPAFENTADIVVEGEKLIIVNNKLIERGIENGTYDLVIKTVGYNQFSQEVTLTKACQQAPGDVKLQVNLSNSDLEILSDDKDWLEALTKGHVQFRSNNYWDVAYESNMTLESDRVVFSKDSLSSLKIVEGDYTLDLYAYRYGDVRRTIHLDSYVKEMTAQITVNGETGDLIVTCDDTEFLNAVAAFNIYETRDGVTGQVQRGGSIDLFYPEEYRYYNLNNYKYTNYDNDEENVYIDISVSGNQLIVSNKTLMASTYIHNADDLQVTLNAVGYQEVTVKNVVLKHVRSAELPDDVSVSMENNGDMIITSKNKEWLQGICVPSDYNNMDYSGGRVTFWSDMESGGRYGVNIYNDLSEDTMVFYENGQVRIPQDSFMRARIKNGEYPITITAYGFIEYSYDKNITVSKGAKELPQNIDINFSKEGIEFYSNDSDWMQALQEHPSSHVSIHNAETSKNYLFAPIQLDLVDGELILPMAEMYNAGVEDGTYNVCAYAYGYDRDYQKEIEIVVEESPDFRKLTLDETAIQLYLGEQKQLHVLEETEVIWTTSDPNIATVNEEGVVTAVASGKAIIRAVSVEDSEWFGECEVTVYSDEDLYGDILPEDRPEDPRYIPQGLWMSDFTFNNGEAAVTYHPSIKSYVPDSFRVYDGNKLLKLNEDYTVKYSNNNKAASKDAAKAPTVTVTGKGNYVGTLSRTFDILPASLDEVNTFVILNRDTFIFNSKVQKPTVSVEFEGTKLKANTDYVLTFDSPSSTGVNDYTITIEGKGNYKGTLHADYHIVEANYKPVSSLKISGIKAYTYTGEAILQNVIAKDGTKLLAENEDYTLEYRDNVEAGTGYVIITGTQKEENGYIGSIVKSFKINPISLTGKNTEVLGLNAAYDYQLEPIVPDVELVYAGSVLEKGTDYTITLKNNNKAGTATMTFKGTGNYKGSFSKTFKINKLTLKEAMFGFDVSYDYTKGGVKPLPVTELVNNKDFTLAYKNNTKLSASSGLNATVTVKGKGNYEGTLVYTFEVLAKDIGETALTVQDKVYSKKVNSWKSTISLTDTNGKKLAVKTDYDSAIEYTYAKNTYVNVGSVTSEPVLRRKGDPVEKNDILPVDALITVKVTGKGNYKGSISGTYRIVGTSVSKATVSIPDQYYSGSPVTFSEADITVKVGKTVLDPYRDYEIVSFENNTEKGTAKVTIRGIGAYGGTKTVSFKIKQRTMGLLIRYYSNGATSGTMKDQIIYKDTALTANAFKKTINGAARTFLGWSLYPNGPIAYSNKQMIHISEFEPGSELYLYAKWEGGEDEASVITLDMSTLYIVPTLEATKNVEDAINNYLQNTLHENYKIKLRITAIGDYFQKIPMQLAAGGEDTPDIIQVFNLADYVDNGYILPLDPYLNRELKPAVDMIGKIIPNGKANGRIYMLPRFFGTVLDWKWIYNKELVDASEVDVSGVHDLDSLETVLEQLKVVYPEENFLVYCNQFDRILQSELHTSQIGTYAATVGDSTTLYDYYETDAFRNAVYKAYEFRQKGYSDPQGSANTLSHDSVVMGGSAKGVIMGHSNDCKSIAQMFTNTNSYGATFDAVTIAVDNLTTDTLGIGISHTCKDPSSAARFINLLYTDKFIWSTLIYGAEGQDYVWNEDHTKVRYPDGLDFNTVPYNCMYSCGMIGNGFDFFLEYEDGDGNPTGSNGEYGKYLFEKAWAPPLYGFIPSTSRVSTQIEAVQQVVEQYSNPLQYGDVDPSVEYPKFIAALKAAGIDDIVADYQVQANAWLKGN